EQLKDRINIVSDQRLWKWRWLDEEEPVKVARRKLPGGCLVHVVRWANVHQPQFGEPIRMVERQTMGDTRASVMANHPEPAITKLFHDFNLVQCHRTL